MKTKLLIARTGWLLATISTYAQNKASNFIGFNVGASIPTGDFSKTEAGSFGNWNNNTGYAKTGFTVGAEGAFYFHPNIGLGGTVYLADHGGFSKSDLQKLGD